MPVTIGSLVGSNSLTDGSKTINVTLSADAPAGNPTTPEGLLVYTMFDVESTDASFEANQFTDARMRPLSITDSSPLSAPYFGIANKYWTGYVSWWNNVNTRAFSPTVPDEMVRRDVLFGGSYYYEILHLVASGSTITVDYSHIPYDFYRLAVKMYRVTGLKGTNTDGPDTTVDQPTGSGWGDTISGASSNSPCLGEAGFPTSYPVRYSKFTSYAGCACTQIAFEPTADETDPLIFDAAGGVGTDYAELGNFNGRIYDGAVDPDLEVPYRIGFAVHDFGASTVDTNVCYEYDTTDSFLDVRGISVLFSEGGAGYPYTTITPGPARVHLNEVRFRSYQE